MSAKSLLLRGAATILGATLIALGLSTLSASTDVPLRPGADHPFAAPGEIDPGQRAECPGPICWFWDVKPSPTLSITPSPAPGLGTDGAAPTGGK